MLVVTVKRTTVRSLAAPVSFDADDQALLNQTMDYYHQRLTATTEALAYLQSRGLAHPEPVATFQLGVADRTLGLRLPEKTRKAGADIRTRLLRIGLIRDSGADKPTAPGDVLALNGQPVGEKAGGAGPGVRTVTPGQLDGIIDELKGLGALPGSKGNYSGDWYDLPNNQGGFGIRDSRGSGRTVDVNIHGFPRHNEDPPKAITNLLIKTGITDVEWIRSTVDEARSDPVGMWRMIRAGREQFCLAGSDLEDFVRRFITEMIKADADPIVGNKAAALGWSSTLKYGDDPASAADALVREWLDSNADPDVDGVWFAFPAVWK